MRYKQGTQEWLDVRRNYIGGSDAPVIMQDSPWKTPFHLFEEKMGIRKQPETEAMRRGKALETQALQLFSDQIGIEFDNPVEFHPEVPYILGSFDGLNKEKRVAVEIKCPMRSDHEAVKAGIWPEHYYGQFQHLIKVAELDEIWYCSFNGRDIEVLKVPRNEVYIQKLLEEEKRFWERLKNFDPPELMEKDFCEKNDFEWTVTAEEYLDVKKRIQLLEEKQETLRNNLISMCGDENCKGAGIKVYKTARKGVVDYKRIEVLRSLDLEQYRKPSTMVWSIR